MVIINAKMIKFIILIHLFFTYYPAVIIHNLHHPSTPPIYSVDDDSSSTSSSSETTSDEEKEDNFTQSHSEEHDYDNHMPDGSGSSQRKSSISSVSRYL